MAFKRLSHSGMHRLFGHFQRCDQRLLCRAFHLEKVLCGEQKLTIQLLPEVEKQLEAGEIKHRKHPGVLSSNPFVVPEALKNAVDKLITKENEKTLLKDAEFLKSFLKSRRLPAEPHEIEQEIRKMIPRLEDGFDGLSEKLPKHELRKIRKRVALEIGRWKPIEYNHHECLVYLTGRLAANYASTCHVFQQLLSSFPSYKPTSYFDFGSGVGSSLWAAHSVWSDSLKEYFCVDASAEMNDLCYNILTDEVTELKLIKPVFFRQFLPASDSIKYDVVVSAFSLLDLPNISERLRVIDALWRKTKDFLIFIEYGSTAGFKCVLDARDFILHVENDPSPQFSSYDSGAYVVSPCPHDSSCPKMLGNDMSCGFLVPYQILFPHHLRQATAKDWISYVILRKGSRPTDVESHPRIVKPVLNRTRHVHCRLCCPDGKLHDLVVTKAKHGRHAYRCARMSSQGDSLPVNLLKITDEQPEEN